MSNFNPGNYYRNIDRYGSEIVNEGAPDFVPTPINYTPAASGNTQNINEFVIDPNGDMYFIDADGESFKINTNNPLDVLTTAQPTPTATGNTTNLNSVFVDTNGEYWVVDWKGDAIKVGPKDVVTTVTNTVTGNKIATYTNELGAVVDINETITVLGNLTYDPVTGLLTIPYTDEAGVVNNKTATISQLNVLTTVQPTPSATGNTTNLNSAFVDASGNSWIVDSNGDAILTGTAVSISNVQALGNKIADITIGGVTTSIKETITSISAFSISGNTITLTYIDEAGATNTKTLDVPSDVITNITNTVTGHKIGTYTNESGVAVDINETITTITNTADGSATGITNLIGTYTNEDGIEVDINENVTQLTELNSAPIKNGIAEFKNEQGVVTTISETVTSVSDFSISGNTITLSYVDETGTTNTETLNIPSDVVTTLTNTVTGNKIGTYTNESGTVVDINETITTLTKSGTTYTYTSENGTVTTFDLAPLDVNLTPITYTPTSTGNTSNLNSLVVDPLGDIYIIDSQGDAKKLNVAQVVTTLTNTVTGNKIGTYTNENGVAVDINETVTSLVDNGDGTITYTNENGTATIVTLGSEGAPVTVGVNPPTGTSIEGAIHLVTDDGTPTGTVLEQYIYDTDSGVWIEMQRNAQDLIKFGTSSPTANGEWDGEEYFVTSTGTSAGTVSEQWIWDKQSATWVQRPTTAPELVQFGTTAPTSTTGYTAGDEYFVTSNGTSTGTITAQYIFNGTTWTLRPTPTAQLTTTSIVPKVYQSGAYVNAQANIEANVADLIQLSDGSRIHDGEVTWTGHGLTVGAWYYLDQSAPGGYTTTRPTSGLVQQLFFVEDANTIHVDIEEAWTVGGTSSETFAKTVYVNTTSPTTATIFDLDNPPITNDDSLKADDNNIYIGTDGSTWTYKTSTGTYSTYVYPTTTPIVLNASGAATSNVPANAWTNITGYTSTTTNTAGTGWNATTGVFTAPRAGYYHAIGGVEIFSASNVAGQITVVQILKNGTTGVSATREVIQATYAGVNMTGPTVGNVYLNAGETLQLRVFSSQGTRSISNSASTYFNINEIK